MRFSAPGMFRFLCMKQITQVVCYQIMSQNSINYCGDHEKSAHFLQKQYNRCAGTLPLTGERTILHNQQLIRRKFVKKSSNLDNASIDV